MIHAWKKITFSRQNTYLREFRGIKSNIPRVLKNIIYIINVFEPSMNTVLYQIDNLRMWKSGNWIKYDTESSPLLLRLHYDQLLITTEQNVIESLSINWKLKGIFKDDVLIIIVSVIGEEVRKIKFQIKENLNQCLQKLGSRFPVVKFGSDVPKKRFRGKYRNIENILKKSIENKDTVNSPVMPAEYKNFVKLCLLDPSFPQLVTETEDIIREYEGKTIP